MRAIIFSSVWLFFSFNASARWLTVKESPSVVKKLYMEFNVAKDGTWSQTVEYIVSVQSEDAKNTASLFTVDYNSVTDKVDIMEAYTKNGSKKIKVEPSAIEDRDKGDSRDYDSIRVKSILYPQVQVGSDIYIKYKVTTTKPLLKDRWSTIIGLGPGVHILDYRLKVKSERPLYVDVKDPESWMKSNQRNPNSFEMKNRKTIPGWVHAEKDPVFHPNRFVEVTLTTEKNWAGFFGNLNRDYEKIILAELPVQLKALAHDAAKKKTIQDKIAYVLDKFSREYRYFGDWRRHDGGLVPRSLKEIESSRYGDCKDLSTLLTATLRSMGLNAEVALIRRGENPYGTEPDYNLPAINRFNHAIVRVLDGKDSYWLDPTNPVTSVRPFPDISGRPAFILGSNGVGHMERTPPAKAEDYSHIHNYAYRFNKTDDVNVKVHAELKGLAPYRLANELMSSPKSEVLSTTLEYFSEGQDVRKFHYNEEPKTTRTLKDMTVGLDYTAGKVAYNAGPAMFWVIPDGFLEGAFYETDNRESDIRLAETPYNFKSVRRLVNTKLAQEAPAPCHLDSDWMTLDRKVFTEGQDVVIEQWINLKKTYITRAEFRSKPFKDLQNGTKKCFHRSGVLIEPLIQARNRS